MRDSRGEIKIYEILEDAGINFEEEYSFPDLVSNRGAPLRFDFAVFDDDGEIAFLIEYQGVQHYQAKSVFGGKNGLRRQQYNDILKKRYCLNHGYTLVEIPYTDLNFLDYDYIMKAGYGW